MNYEEKRLEIENKMLNYKAEMMAHKKNLEEQLKKRQLAEKEIKQATGVSFEEAPAELLRIENEQKELIELSIKLAEEIESELRTIKK